MNPAPHCAPFSAPILDAIGVLAAEYGLDAGSIVVDPFAGIGRLGAWAETHQRGWNVVGVEIEPEWAIAHRSTIQGDARDLRDVLAAHEDVVHARIVGAVDAIITSPAYGNRMADGYAGEPCPDCKGQGVCVRPEDGVALPCDECKGAGRLPTKRYTYRLSLGRDLTDGNGAALQWGTEYRRLHLECMQQWPHVTQPGGLVIVNMSDHIRGERQQPVTAWWLTSLIALGYDLVEIDSIGTRRQRNGANGDARAEREHLLVLRHGNRISEGRLL